MAALFQPGNSGKNAKGNRFDLSGSRVKTAADVAEQFRFADTPGATVPGQTEHMQQAGVNEGKAAPGAPGAPGMFDSGNPANSANDGPLYGYRKHRFRKRDEVSPFDAQEDARRRDPRTQIIWVLGIVAVVSTITCIILPNRIFSDDVTRSFADLVTLVTARTGDLIAYVSGSGTSINAQPDIWRYIIIALSGAALGMTGAVYQGALKNALASPTTLGVTAGGTLGSMIYIVVTYSAVIGSGQLIVSASTMIEQFEAMSPLDYFLARNGQALFALVGCIAVMVIVLVVAHIAGHGKLSSVALIVAGQVMMMTINAASNLIRYYYSATDPFGPISIALRSIRSLSFNGLYYPIDALVVAVPLLICMGIIMGLRFRLSLLSFSDEEARSMGISITATRNLMIGVTTIMTSVVIAFGGNTGFVGFIVPHLTRRIIGPDFKYLVPASALLGSSFLVITYFITALFESLAGGVGLFTSIIGGVMFIVIALRSRKQNSADVI